MSYAHVATDPATAGQRSPALDGLSDEEFERRGREVLDDLGRQLQARWYDDPVQFAWDVFGTRLPDGTWTGARLWSKQRAIARAVAATRGRRGKKRVAVKSGQKSGKSWLAAILAIWWAVTRPLGRVVLTAPSGHQVRNILWQEVQKLFRVAEQRLLEQYGIEGGIGGHIYDMPDRGLQFLPGNEIIGRATNTTERMQGVSGKELFFIVDEASGVDQAIIEAIEGNTQGGGIILLLGNPNQTSGELYEAFEGSKHELYACFTINSEENPNFVTRHEVIEGLATYDSILARRIAWGGLGGYATDIRYQVRVLGEFPSQASDAVITRELVRLAKSRWFAFAAGALDKRHRSTERRALFAAGAWEQVIQTPEEHEHVYALWTAGPELLEIGVDPALFGVDSTAIFPRRGHRLFRPVQVRKHDEHEVASVVVKTARELARNGETPVVRVDAIGLGVAIRALLRKEPWLRVVSVVSSENAQDPHEYMNLRAEMHFRAAQWIKDGGGFAPHKEFEGDVLAPRYGFDKHGRLKVEEKAQIKKRLGRSPDLGDAWMLAVLGTNVRRLELPDGGGRPRLPPPRGRARSRS